MYVVIMFFFVCVCFFFSQIAELQVTCTGLETERDFYFAKLRDIEVLCQESEDNPLVQPVLEVMYATQVSLQVDLCRMA